MNAEEVLTPKVPALLRVLFQFESTGWFETTKEEKEEQLLPTLEEIFQEWRSNGARLIGTIDADLLATGRSGGRGWHACFLFDVPDLQTVTAMTHLFRERGLDRYFRVEAIIGRPFTMLEK